MEANLMESKSQFSFRLDGNNEIDAALLADTIKNISELTKLAAREKEPDAYIKMNVTAFKNGSFQIDFSAICNVVESLITPPNIAYAASIIIAVVTGFFEVKRVLKGKKPKNVEELPNNKIKIENQNGDTVIVEKGSEAIINNVNIDQLTINISNNSKEHNPDGGFTVSGSQGESHFSSDDINNMSKSLPIEDIVNCQRNTFRAEIPIKKAVLLGKSKWGFMLNEKSIEASIEDEEFIDSIRDGETIKAGDYIDVTLEVYCDLSVLGTPVAGTEKYTVKKVFGTIKHDYYEQLEF